MKARTIVVPVALAGLAASGVFYAAQNRPVTLAYVTAPVVRGSITQTFVASGTVDRSGRDDVTFDTPGTVTALSVKVGDQVTKGQALAGIDPAPLQVAVLQAQAQLAQAKAVQDADQTAYDNGGTVSALPAGLGVPTSGATAGTGAPQGTGAGAGMPGAPGAGQPTTPPYILALQGSMAGLQKAVTTQQAACQPVYALAGKLQSLSATLPTSLPTSLPTGLPTGHPTGLPTALPTGLPSRTPSQTATANPSASPSSSASAIPSPSASPTLTPSASGSRASSPSPSPTEAPSATATPTASVTPTASTTPSASATAKPAPTASVSLPSVDPAQAQKLAGQIQACTTAMVNLATAEQEAGQAIVTASAGMQQATAAAQAQLVAAQQQMATAAQAAAQQAAAQAMAQAQAQLAAQAARAMGSKVTDATLESDRARVLQAQQALDKAQRTLDGATMTSPVDGTVGAVSLVAGEGSAGRSVTVIGPGAAEVKVEVPLSTRPLVTTGQPAHVGLVGADAELTGSVTSVSVLPTSTSGTPTYTATVLVDDPQLVLKPGAVAEVSLALANAADVLTVPLSAVTKTSDTTGTVEVVADASAASARTVNVVTGVYGGGRIEIASGLVTGQLVVLADRRQPVPGGLAQYQMRSASPSPTATQTR